MLERNAFVVGDKILAVVARIAGVNLLEALVDLRARFVRLMPVTNTTRIAFVLTVEIALGVATLLVDLRVSDVLDRAWNQYLVAIVVGRDHHRITRVQNKNLESCKYPTF